MDREKMLKVSLQSWLLNESISEIIITDWSSKKSLEYLTKLDKRIKIIRIDNEKYFHKSKALNIALKESKADKIMQMDVDYILNPYFNFFSDFDLKDNQFFVGDGWSKDNDMKNRFITPTNGFIYTFRSSLQIVNGWNEELEGYGFDDNDLINKLKKLGLESIVILLSKRPYLYHNPHDSKESVINYRNKNTKDNWYKNFEKSTKQKHPNDPSNKYFNEDINLDLN